MDKYKRLISNTAVFAIGTLGSKLLVFLMLPFYTRVLTTADYGTIDLIINAANLFIPVVTFSVVYGVMRFGLDEAHSKRDVLSGALQTVLAGFALFLLFAPLVSRITYISGYVLLVYLFVLAAALHQNLSHFVRTNMQIRLFAVDGALNTAMVVVLNVFFLGVFKLGISGYVLSTIIADFLSCVFLFFAARLWRYMSFKPKFGVTLRAMLKYTVPLIPTAICWWITNLSDRYMVTWMIGVDANGLYAVSYRIPTLIVILSNVFLQAWQVSAVVEENGSADGKGAFFTKVFDNYQSLLFIASAALIALCRPITSILVSAKFYDSWMFIPLLLIATAYSCFANYINTVYMVTKKSVMTLITTLVGAVINIALNFALIPVMGANGAALATLISYLVIYAIRIVNTRRFIRVDVNLPRHLENLLILCVQSAVLLLAPPGWIIYEAILFMASVALNFKVLMQSAAKVLKMLNIRIKKES